jgi:hypothetical protein
MNFWTLRLELCNGSVAAHMRKIFNMSASYAPLGAAEYSLIVRYQPRCIDPYSHIFRATTVHTETSLAARNTATNVWITAVDARSRCPHGGFLSQRPVQ